MVSNTLFGSLLFASVYGGIAGSYKASGVGLTQSCSTPAEAIFKDDHTVVKASCAGPGSTVKFGKWIQTSPTTIMEFLIEGNNELKIQETPQGSTIIDGGLSMHKVEPSSVSLSAVANVFGEWKAPQPQSDEDCSVVSGLSILNNGQILRYFCKGGNSGWFAKGYFRISSYRDSLVTFSTTFNSTAGSLALTSEGPNTLKYENITLTRVA